MNWTNPYFTDSDGTIDITLCGWFNLSSNQDANAFNKKFSTFFCTTHAVGVSSSTSIQVCLYNTESSSTDNLVLSALSTNSDSGRIVTNITRESLINNWYFLALSFKSTSSSSGTLYLHYRSAFEPTLNVSSLDNFHLNTPHSASFNIGINRIIVVGDNIVRNTYLQGLFKDFRIYDKQLSNDELLNISNSSYLPDIDYLDST